jgi:hypothetical protein
MYWQVEECRSGPLRTMSVPGPKQTFESRSAMSAFGGKADIPALYRHVRF